MKSGYFKIVLSINIILLSISTSSQITTYHERFEDFNEIEDDFFFKDHEYDVTVYAVTISKNSLSSKKKFIAKYSFNKQGKLTDVIRFINTRKGFNNPTQHTLTKESLIYDENFNVVSIQRFIPNVKIKHSKRDKKIIDKKLAKASWTNTSFEIFKYNFLNNTISHYSGITKSRDTLKAIINYKHDANNYVRYVKYPFVDSLIQTDSFVVNNDTIFHFKSEIFLYKGNTEIQLDWPLWRVKYYHHHRDKFVTVQTYNPIGVHQKFYNDNGLPDHENYSEEKSIVLYDYDSNGLLRKKSTIVKNKIIYVQIYEYDRID